MPSMAATRLFIEWGVFEAIPQTGSISYEELAQGAQAETALISTEILSLH